MEIKPQGLYSIKEVALFLSVTERNLQMKAKRMGKKKIDNRYLFNGHEILEMASKRNKRTEKSTEKHTEQKRNKKIDNTIIRLILEINDTAYIKEVLTAIKQGDIIERLTEDEHRNFISRLTEANVLEERIIQYKEEIARMEDYVKDYRNNVEYLKTSLSKQQEQTEILLNSLTQRNYIEAKEKGFDKK